LELLKWLPPLTESTNINWFLWLSFFRLLLIFVAANPATKFCIAQGNAFFIGFFAAAIAIIFIHKNLIVY